MALTWHQLIEELLKDTPALEKELSQELLQESDRGLSLISAEVLNEELEKLFRLRCPIKNPTHVKKLVDPLFQRNGPLNTFAARISMAYAVGYITEPLFLDLERVRSIRNKFAHSQRPLRLTTPSISALIRQFLVGHRSTSLFLIAEKGNQHAGVKVTAPERWQFLGAFLEIRFALKCLNGSHDPSRLAADLKRIKKEFYPHLS